jgi:hypothetical protein
MSEEPTMRFHQTIATTAMLLALGYVTPVVAGEPVHAGVGAEWVCRLTNDITSKQQTRDIVVTVQAQTPITQCENLPPSTSIEVFSNLTTIAVCREVLGILEGVTIENLRDFEKAAVVFSAKGYRPGEYKRIAAELVDIIRLRGLYNKRDRWGSTIDIVWKAFAAFNGVVTPYDIDEILRASGPMAKTLSDDGLLMQLSS